MANLSETRSPELSYETYAALANKIIFRQHQRREENENAYRLSDEALAEFLDQTQTHLLNLFQSPAIARESLFIDFIAWVKTTWVARGIPAPVIEAHFAIMADVLREELPLGLGATHIAVLETARERFAELPLQLPSSLSKSVPLVDMAEQYLELLLGRERNKACRLIVDAVQNGVPVRHIYLYVFQPALEEIGRLWQLNRVSVAHEHYCSAATQLIMSQLYPYIFTQIKTGPRIVVTCAAGELHEFGPRMLADLFELEGWDTCYLGANTPVASVVDMLIEHRAGLLAVSATLSNHLGSIRAMVAVVRGDHRCQQVRILVGGDPFFRVPDLWREFGADGTAGNAEEAIDWVKRLAPGG